MNANDAAVARAMQGDAKTDVVPQKKRIVVDALSTVPHPIDPELKAFLMMVNTFLSSDDAAVVEWLTGVSDWGIATMVNETSFAGMFEDFSRVNEAVGMALDGLLAKMRSHLEWTYSRAELLQAE
jgi:hypothetical protein